VVSHKYMKEGVYQVSLNVTNNEGFSSMKTFQILVESVPLDIALIIRAGLLVSAILLAFAFAYLILTRKNSKDETKTQRTLDQACLSETVFVVIWLQGSHVFFEH
jgi:PKD repeat protein